MILRTDLLFYDIQILMTKKNWKRSAVTTQVKGYTYL